MKTQAAKYWMGPAPTKCDVSGADITDRFIDGKILGGPWANMCPAVHQMAGCGLGTGRGQEYTKQSDGRWLKTGG